MVKKIKSIISDYKIVAIVIFLLVMAASLQSLLSGTKTYVEGGIEYNRYNNYTIFEKSFHHLKDSKDLYKHYPEEHWDLFKYSPTFAVFFGIFAIFPDGVGLTMWNFLNAFILLIGVYLLPRLNNYQKGLILLICITELMTSMQNEQSNALIAGLIILAFAFLEKDKFIFATLLIAFSVFIKLFGIVGFALFLFYPKKWKLALYSLLWTILLLLLPLIFIDFEQYKLLMSSYVDLLSNDHSASYGYSVMGWINSWFGAEFNKLYVVLAGVIFFLIPLFRIRQHKNYTFRILALASVLLWVVIFNHKAESPTFVIAMAGVALWFIPSEKTVLNIILFSFVFIFTALGTTDAFPRVVREEFIKPYSLKAFPCILVWAKIVYDMIMLKKDRISSLDASNSTNLHLKS